MSKFTILDYYLKQSKDTNYVEEFRSTSDSKSGKTFWHINVNFRMLSSFADAFSKFEHYDGKDRSTWEVYSNNEQKAKHWTVRMQQSKLFTKSNGFYIRTAKGEAFADFINVANDPQAKFNQKEKWVIIYLFLLNSYFNLKSNYIINRTNQIFNLFIKNKFDLLFIQKSFVELLKKGENIKREELFKLDAFWILTFIEDKNFLSIYKEATFIERNQLFDYVIAASKGSKEEIKKKNDLIGWKYVSGGQYLPSTFYDDIKTLYVTYFSLKLNNTDTFVFLRNICKIHNEFSYIDVTKMEKFVLKHLDVFESIFNESILNKTIDTDLNETEQITLNVNLEQDVNEEKIDDTTTKTNQQLRKTSLILKRIAKERAHNNCELELLNNCKYFTSKESETHYLEIHHLIPFEFNNEFENSLEVVENYIALCPHCHRLLHFGADRERMEALRFLYNKRKDSLEKKCLKISLKELLAYYGIEDK